MLETPVECACADSLPAVQLILVGTGAATIWIMPFMDYWDNVTSITSMGGRALRTCPLPGKYLHTMFRAIVATHWLL